MIANLFSDPGFMPHIHCYLDRQPLVWTMFVTDLIIGLSYFGISITLCILFRRIQISFSLVVLCFGVFIGACGATHFMEVLTLWHPSYWAAAAIKALTALASIGTCLYLFRLRHEIIGVAEAAKAAEQHRLNLEMLTRELEERVAQRTLQLTENEKRYQQSMSAARVGVWEWDMQSNKVNWNGQSSELYDLDLPKDTQQDFSYIMNRIHPEDRARVLGDLQSATTEHQEVRTEFRVATRNGKPRWLMAVGRAEYDAESRPIRTFGINTDITERRLAEESRREIQAKLAESEENFRLVANSIPQLAWMTREDGWIIWYNQKWYDYTGTTLEEMQGWGWTKVHHPDHTDRVTAKWQHHLQSGENWEDTFPLRSKDGSYRWFLSRALPVRNAGGKITRWFGTNTDITELRDALRSRDAFLSIASHELKTPLTSLQLAVQLKLRDLRRGNPRVFNAEEFNHFLTTQSSHMNRLNRLIDDFLDVSQIAEGRLHLQVEEFDLCKMASEVVERFRVTADAAGVAVVMGDDKPLIGRWDRFRLEQVLVNLLTNALKYGKKNPIHVRTYIEGSKAILSVRDHGMGISPADQERIFNRYERAISENEVSGLGLGLYISKEIIKAHGGTIQVKSKPHEGSEFLVALPHASSPQEHDQREIKGS